MSAAFDLELGAKHPYDATDMWKQEPTDPITLEPKTPPPAATDWAHAAARGIVSNLRDRRGIKQGFEGIDQDTRAEIVSSIAEIIRESYNGLVPPHMRVGR